MKFTIRVVTMRFARNGAVICGGDDDNNRPMEGDVVQYNVYEKQFNWNSTPEIGHSIQIKLQGGKETFKVVNVGHEELSTGTDAERVIVVYHNSHVQAGMMECDGMDSSNTQRALQLILALRREELDTIFMSVGFGRSFGPESSLSRFDGIL